MVTKQHLKFATKHFIMRTLQESRRFLRERSHLDQIISLESKVLALPTNKSFEAKSLKKLRSLKIAQVQWSYSYNIKSLGFTLSDGKSCRTGNENFEDSHTFDPQKKITKVVCKYGDDELR